MAIQTGDSDEMVSDINVTPLVDVMLVLLVVFIVTAPLLTNAIKVTLPSTATTSAPEQKQAVTVSVDAKGKVYVDKSEVALSALETQLKRVHAGQPDVSVQLSADESSNYGLIAKVMSSINRSGVTKLSVLSVGE
ncbi:MAG: outer rane transport energization protein ExbD [Myxococcaceae bacterium]|nr:outer rane transport energization protein ExbD [Myxococcaceae bacterium]